jgi:hypothetical protein
MIFNNIKQIYTFNHDILLKELKKRFKEYHENSLFCSGLSNFMKGLMVYYKYCQGYEVEYFFYL